LGHRPISGAGSVTRGKTGCFGLKEGEGNAYCGGGGGFGGLAIILEKAPRGVGWEENLKRWVIVRSKCSTET